MCSSDLVPRCSDWAEAMTPTPTQRLNEIAGQDWYRLKTRPIPKMTALELSRFLWSIQKPDEFKSSCWRWLGRKSDKGYGSFHLRGRNYVAHRISYTHFKGAITPGLTIDHVCRNKECTNPSHLRELTNKQNILAGTGVTANNARKTHCPKGHPYSGKNLMVKQYANSMPVRRCLECQRIHSRQLVVALSKKRRLARKLRLERNEDNE